MRVFLFGYLGVIILLSNHLNALEEHDHPWSKIKHIEMVNQAQETLVSESHKYPSLEYPVSDPIQLYAIYNSETIPIFSYGSLLNKESASRTLSDKAMTTHRPALSFGTKRVFNRHVPNTSRWGPKERPNDTGMLNVIQTEDLSHVVNGVVIEVDIDDLKNLLLREEGYDLVPVVVTCWNDVINDDSHKNYFVAYTFQASDDERVGVHYTNRYINPVTGYALASKQGAEQYGESFLKLWVSSTYLADKETQFSLWEIYPEVDCTFEEGCAISTPN
ncbi:MAG: gamma-glutamylcyclotransferase family protein [Chlamydiota bacterium]